MLPSVWWVRAPGEASSDARGRGATAARAAVAVLVVGALVVLGWWLVVPRHTRSYDGELVLDRWGEPCGTYSLVFQREGERPLRHTLATWGMPGRPVPEEPFVGAVVVAEWSAPLRQSPEWQADVPGVGEVTVGRYVSVSNGDVGA